MSSMLVDSWCTRVSVEARSDLTSTRDRTTGAHVGHRRQQQTLDQHRHINTLPILQDYLIFAALHNVAGEMKVTLEYRYFITKL